MTTMGMAMEIMGTGHLVQLTLKVRVQVLEITLAQVAALVAEALQPPQLKHPHTTLQINAVGKNLVNGLLIIQILEGEAAVMGKLMML